MRRPAAMVILMVVGSLLAAPPAGAGGGGCARPVTEDTGGAVTIRDACFAPTILRVERGTDVTWTNRDGFDHDLVGANWRWYGDAWRSETLVVRRFQKVGVYPYACSLHPGMVGAIIVGDVGAEGTGGKVVEVLGVRPAAKVGMVRADPPVPPPASPEPWRMASVGFALLVVVLAGALLRPRWARPGAGGPNDPREAS